MEVDYQYAMTIDLYQGSAGYLYAAQRDETPSVRLTQLTHVGTEGEHVPCGSLGLYGSLEGERSQIASESGE